MLKMEICIQRASMADAEKVGLLQEARLDLYPAQLFEL